MISFSAGYRVINARGEEITISKKPEIAGVYTKQAGKDAVGIYGKVYGCPTVESFKRRGILRKQNRIRFENEKAAVANKFRPCGSCMREKFKQWKANPEEFRQIILSA